MRPSLPLPFPPSEPEVSLSPEEMKHWLSHPAAQELLRELHERQLAVMNALIRADAEDPGTLAALRIAQGAQQVIDYVEARVEEARTPEKEAKDEGY